MNSRSRALLGAAALIAVAVMSAGCGPDRPETPIAPAPPAEAERQIQKVAGDRDMPVRIRGNLVAQFRGPAPHDSSGVKQAARVRSADRSKRLAE